MNDCQDCEQRNCCIVNGTQYCNSRCIRVNCYSILCTIQWSIWNTKQEQCRFSDNEACCYISVRTGQFQGQQSYWITRICHEHCPTVDCECLICHEHHDMSRYEVDVLTIRIKHHSITDRNGYPEAQAYVFARDLSPQTIQSREVELRQVTGSPGNSSMVQ